MGPLAHLSHSSHTLVTYLCIRSTSASPGATDRFLPQVHPPGASCPRAPGRPGMGFQGGAGGDLGAHSRGNPEGGGSYPQRILGRRVGGINTACPRVEHSGARGGGGEWPLLGWVRASGGQEGPMEEMSLRMSGQCRGEWWIGMVEGSAINIVGVMLIGG